jgi:hypothetical protein
MIAAGEPDVAGHGCGKRRSESFNQQLVRPAVAKWRKMGVHHEVDDPQYDSDRVEQLQANRLFLQQIIGERSRPVAVGIRDILGSWLGFEEFVLQNAARLRAIKSARHHLLLLPGGSTFVAPYSFSRETHTYLESAERRPLIVK